MRKTLKMIAVLLTVTVATLPAVGQETLQIRGSDTMVNLIQRMAEVYIEKYPDKQVAVTGGGSGTGIAGLRNRTVDIADSSRDMKGREIIDARAKGVDPVRVVVCLDCITIVTNKANPVSKLTAEQLGGIFRGEIANWKDVGGEDKPITLYGRQSNSGTFVKFREEILKGDYADTMRRMNGNAQIIESVKSDKAGVGYVGVGHAKNEPELKVISIAASPGSEFIDPTKITSAEAETYAIVRTLNQYVNGKPEGDIKHFVEFELSPEGQKICEEMGFLPLNEKYTEENKQVM